MKPGDLRQFKDGLLGSEPRGVGRPFVVLEVEGDSWVSFLIEGRVERGWGRDWVERNSEVINEIR